MKTSKTFSLEIENIAKEKNITHMEAVLWHCKKEGIPIIDASKSITAFHQQHSYPSKKLSYFKEECEYNYQLAGGDTNLMNIREADYVFNLSKKELKRPSGTRFWLAIFSNYRFYGYSLAIYRKLKKWYRDILYIK